MAATSSPDPSLSPMLSTTLFVGRERELAELSAGLDAAYLGRGQVLLLVGEPGIGKTRLAEEFTVQARARGALVLWGQCYEWDGAPPYWPWFQALRACLQRVAPEAVRAALGRGAADIAQVLPEVAEVVPDVPILPSLPSLEPERARFQLFDSITMFLGNVAHIQPTVIVLDDLHWADTPSLLLLQFLARALRESRLLVLGTYRNVEVGRQHPLAGTLADLARQPGTQRIMLRGLPEPDVRRVVSETTGHEPSSELVAAVFEQTDGNPFFVAEVARLLTGDDANDHFDTVAWDRRVPESVREVIGRRLERLSAECNRVLAIAAVVGREFSVSILERVSDFEAVQLLDLLDESVEAQIVQRQAGPGAYRFSHVLVQETLYAELSTATRVRLHGSVATALEQTFAANINPVVANLARHYFEAAPLGKADQAITYAIRAAQQVTAQVAWEEAGRHYERALQVLDLVDHPDEQRRCDILLALAEAQFSGGDAERATTTFRQAVELARQLGAHEQIANAMTATAYRGYAIGFTYSELRPLLDEVLTNIDPRESILRVRLLSRLAQVLYFFPDTHERRRVLSDDAVATARRLGDPATLAYALHERFGTLWDPSNAEGRRRDLTEVVEIASTAGFPDIEASARADRIFTILEFGDVPAAEADLAALVRLAHESRVPLDQWWAAASRSALAMLAGRFAESERLMHSALASGQLATPPTSGLAPERGLVRCLFSVRREQSGSDELERLLEQAIGLTPTSSLAFFDIHKNWRCLVLLLLCDLGRTAEAHEEFQHLAEQDFADFRKDPLWLNSLVFLAEACVVLHDQPRAALLMAMLDPYAQFNVVNHVGHISYGSVAHYLGLLATMLERWNDAERYFEQALAMNTHMGAQPFVAHTQHAWARMLLLRGQPGDRQQSLDLTRAALTIAQSLGMSRLAGQLQAQLDALASAVGAKNAAAASGLSPRELEVLRLLADGRSDREIATALFISPRTVMTHVAHILNKLGVSSRTAAASVAMRDGIV